MKLNSSKSWEFDWMKLSSIAHKFMRALITSGVLVGFFAVLQGTVLPELDPKLSSTLGIVIVFIIESLNKLKKDYSQ